MVLTFSGCAIVIIYGMKIMRSKITYDKLETKESSKYNSAFVRANKLSEKAINMAKHLKVQEINKSNLFGLFFMGVLLCLSSLTLPASWIALVGYLKVWFLSSSILGGLLFMEHLSVHGMVLYIAKLITGNKKGLISQL
jgi:hypothetical protein